MVNSKSVSKSKVIARLERLSTLLDSSIPVGSSGYRVGLDPIIGLIPGIGDVFSALLGSYMVIEAAWLGASRWTLGRMMINVAVDALVGAVPVLGDLFDFAFKANQRNLALVKDAKLVNDHDPRSRLSSAFLLTLLFVLGFLASIIAAAFFTAVKVINWALYAAAP